MCGCVNSQRGISEINGFALTFFGEHICDRNIPNVLLSQFLEINRTSDHEMRGYQRGQGQWGQKLDGEQKAAPVRGNAAPRTPSENILSQELVISAEMVGAFGSWAVSTRLLRRAMRSASSSFVSISAAALFKASPIDSLRLFGSILMLYDNTL